MLTTNSSVNSQLPINIDVLIIGGGIAGLATAYYLSQYLQLKTVVLEAKRIGGSHCSSTGEERMYRRMYSSEYLSDLQKKALQEWHSIEAKHNCQLLRENGLLFYGEVWQEETIEGSILGAKKVMEQKNIPFEELDASAMTQRWAIKPRRDFIGLYEKTAGMVWAYKALQVFHLVDLQEGDQIIRRLATRKPIKNWELVVFLASKRLVVTSHNEVTDEDTV